MVPDIPGGSVFMIPDTKNTARYLRPTYDKVVVLNEIARRVVESQRGKHPYSVFNYRGRPLSSMINTGWKKARKKAGISVRVHDLRHTFAGRLRAAGANLGQIKDLLGHANQDITAHYSSAQVLDLYEVVNKICHCEKESIPLIVLKQRQLQVANPHNIPTNQTLNTHIGDFSAITL